MNTIKLSVSNSWHSLSRVHEGDLLGRWLCSLMYRLFVRLAPYPCGGYNDRMLYTSFSHTRRHDRLETRRIESLADPRPFRHLCSILAFRAIPQFTSTSLPHVLCIPLRYLFTLRSKTVYLSLGNISCSVGISIFHLSIFFMLWLCRARALSSVSITESTWRRRSRWRYFWCRDRRHGTFLRMC
jgi:hypothetical protein